MQQGNIYTQKGFLKQPHQVEDVSWDESKHHRADNGQFTRGDARGHRKESEARSKGAHNKEDHGGVDRKEMSQDVAEKHIRDAFSACKCEIKGMKLVGHSINTVVNETNEQTLDAVNGRLKKNGLKAKILDKSTFKIAEDGDEENYVGTPMFAILVCLCAIEMAAKDLHYLAKGRSFYGMHELADIIHDISDGSDDINEVYFLGECGIEPPERSEVAKNAAKKVEYNHREESEIVRLLQSLCEELIDTIEDAKVGSVLKSGTSAVVDDIGRKTLKVSGFLRRITADEDERIARQNKINSVIDRGITIVREGEGCSGEISPIDKVIGKGIRIEGV